MIRCGSVINKRAAKHMKTLKKAMTLDLKIFDTLMQRQEWSLKLDENKKLLTNSIKELQEFSKSFGGLSNHELEKRMKTTIHEEIIASKEEKEDNEEKDADEEEEELTHSRSTFSGTNTFTNNRMTMGPDDMLNNTLDLNDFPTSNKFKGNNSPTGSENPEFEDYIKRLD